eukprot:TRINITY_DN7932_c0_g1_i1.p1 TRINITY_DN7932_c0_g1~~TRINITY_DN7932_c0_g1_i1.p1  ORF type:complete len:136 (-),score=39.97 TRINITY_DN7932_c0_g1_i1:158-565(-)
MSFFHSFDPFRRFFFIDDGEGRREFQYIWNPPLEIKETTKDFVIYVELPGVKKEDLSVEVKDGVLSIQGERKREKLENDDKVLRNERAFGKFARSLRVPEGSESNVSAKLQDGVLELRFPKQEKTAVRRIPISKL